MEGVLERAAMDDVKIADVNQHAQELITKQLDA